MNTGSFIEYVIIVYAAGQVITIIGMADQESAVQAFYKAVADNEADWSYLYRADGLELKRFIRADNQ